LAGFALDARLCNGFSFATTMSDTSQESPSSEPARRTARKTRKKPDKASRPGFEKPEAEGDVSSSGPELAGDSEPKRGKSRRGKKGKGGGAKNAPKEAAVDVQPEPSEQFEGNSGAAEKSREASQSPQPSHPQRQVRHDPGELAKKAWRIYLAEVSEEGVALINDQDAREISKRCFRLAAIFMDEQARQS